MANWALIKDGEVRNKIKAEADFVAKISAAWDFAIDLTGLDPEPDIGWAYDGTNFVVPPPEPIPPETPGQIARREAKERVEAVRGNAPIAGQALQDLLNDMIEVLF